MHRVHGVTGGDEEGPTPLHVATLGEIIFKLVGKVLFETFKDLRLNHLLKCTGITRETLYLMLYVAP